MASPSEKIRELLTARRLGHDANQVRDDVEERGGSTRPFADALKVESRTAERGSLIGQQLLEMIRKLVKAGPAAFQAGHGVPA